MTKLAADLNIGDRIQTGTLLTLYCPIEPQKMGFIYLVTDCPDNLSVATPDSKVFVYDPK